MSDKSSIIEAVSLFGSNVDKFVALILKDADTYYEAIQNSLLVKDFDALVISAHSLKSIMRQAGAHEVADIAFEFEKAGELKILPRIVTAEHLKISYEKAKAILLAVTEAQA